MSVAAAEALISQREGQGPLEGQGGPKAPAPPPPAKPEPDDGGKPG
jgi:hypothetical protein